MSRYFLVTRFRCAACGTNLDLAVNSEITLKEPYHPEASDGITGADKRESNIYLHPCLTCLNKYTAPLNALKMAIEAIK